MLLTTTTKPLHTLKTCILFRKTCTRTMSNNSIYLFSFCLPTAETLIKSVRNTELNALLKKTRTFLLRIPHANWNSQTSLRWASIVHWNAILTSCAIRERKQFSLRPYYSKSLNAILASSISIPIYYAILAYTEN